MLKTCFSSDSDSVVLDVVSDDDAVGGLRLTFNPDVGGRLSAAG